MHTTLIFQLLVLLVVANGAPVLVKKALGDQLAQPFDGGAVLPDGRPLFGSSKTVRGVVSSFLATPLVALLMGFQWEVGALVAGGADLFSSFVKRRLGFPPSSMALSLDQIPESLFPLAACRLLLPVTLVDTLVGVAIFVAGGLILSPILFRLHLRDKPY
jgi:CDP-diglyceride synthetase